MFERKKISLDEAFLNACKKNGIEIKQENTGKLIIRNDNGNAINLDKNFNIFDSYYDINLNFDYTYFYNNYVPYTKTFLTNYVTNSDFINQTDTNAILQSYELSVSIYSFDFSLKKDATYKSMQYDCTSLDSAA